MARPSLAVLLFVGCLSLVAVGVSVAIAPFGDPVRESLFGATAGFCSPEWLASAQIVPPGLALVATAFGAVRRGRRTSWPQVGLAVALLAVWVCMGVVGECGLGGDDA